MTEVDEQVVSTSFPPPLSTLVLAHNCLFQAQLQVMHALVEQQRLIPGGYELLEQLLSAGGGANEGAEGLASAAGGKRRAAWSQETPTPETGCEHDRVFCKNLCRACYQRWRRRLSKEAGGGGAGRERAESFSSMGDDDDDDDDSLGFLSGLPLEDADLSHYEGLLDSDHDDGEGDDDATRLEEASSASSKRTSVSHATSSLGYPPLKKRMKKGPTGGGRRSHGGGGGGPRRSKKNVDLCVQCHLRPTLCRALCNGCYQKWHKQKRTAEERGLPPVPCPSLAILGHQYEERVKGRSVAEATPAAIAAAIAAKAEQQQQQQQEEEEEGGVAVAAPSQA